MNTDPVLLRLLEELLATKMRLEECLHHVNRGITAVSTALETPPPSMIPPLPASRLLRFPEVKARTGLSRSTIGRLERKGSFPLHRIVANHTAAWFDSDITAWIEAHKAR